MSTTPDEPVSDDDISRIENEDWAQNRSEAPERESDDEATESSPEVGNGSAPQEGVGDNRTAGDEVSIDEIRATTGEPPL